VNSFILSGFKKQTDFWTALIKTLLSHRRTSKQHMDRVEKRINDWVRSALGKHKDVDVIEPAEHIQIHLDKAGDCRGCRFSGTTRQANKNA
jgi:Fe-S cluster biogenesis protein NfuA